jgi:tRNA pseudouridine38-40 synthase
MYDGSGYKGWQRLGNTDKKLPIQTVLEECLSQYFEEDIKLIGSGRTDAGAHALGQVANFYCQSMQPVEVMRKGLNEVLPKDIAIFSVEEVGKEFHSRYSAKTKTYEYRIDQGETQSVFTRKYTYHVPTPLNQEAMQKATAYIIGTHDFKAFSTDRKDDKSTIRTIESIAIHNDSGELRITITGNGFLYNMVRIIVGTLLEVGQGNRRPEDMQSILESKNRQRAGVTVSSQGLFLCQVRY